MKEERSSTKTETGTERKASENIGFEVASIPEKRVGIPSYVSSLLPRISISVGKTPAWRL